MTLLLDTSAVVALVERRHQKLSDLIVESGRATDH
jgi:hypothetical protein